MANITFPGGGTQRGNRDKGYAYISGPTRTEIEEASIDGRAYKIESKYTSAGAEDVIYIVNTSTAAQAFLISEWIVGSSVAQVFKLCEVTGTPGGASAISPLSLNTGKSLVAPLTVLGGAAVTGLTAGNELWPQYRLQANSTHQVETGDSILLAPGKAVAVACSAAGDVDVSIIGYLEDATAN